MNNSTLDFILFIILVLYGVIYCFFYIRYLLVALVVSYVPFLYVCAKTASTYNNGTYDTYGCDI